MPLSESSDGKFNYVLNSGSASQLATNRQRKLLKFFGVKIGSGITKGAAGWEMSRIMTDKANCDLWERYLYQTKDFSAESDQPLPHDIEALKSVSIPDDWSIDVGYQQFREDLAAEILSADESPYDVPQPIVLFAGNVFMFTGNFAFGTRDACHIATGNVGGLTHNQKKVSSRVDYLVIGTEGSERWKCGFYGNKIEMAVVMRRERGKPAIISETAWVEGLRSNGHSGLASGAS